MPFSTLRSLDKELRRLDAEHLDVNISRDSKHAKEIMEMRKEGISLKDIQ